MSGHSKWSSIKHKKAALDAKRGKLFTRYIREINIAARLGGGDPDSNPRLRTAIEGARSVNMPNDNIKKAVQRGTGELEGAAYEEISYEGYGPGGVAMIVEAVTDNKNRTVAEVRHVFSKYGGNLGENGCVAWMFARKGLLVVPRTAAEEDALLEIVLENGAEDMQVEDESYEITCQTEDLEQIRQALQDKGVEVLSAERAMIPSTYIELSGKTAQQMIKLIEKLEELDDVQNVWNNVDIPAEEWEQ